MRKDTKLFKILKVLYDRNIKLNAEEISKLSGVKKDFIPAYMIRLANHTKKEKINGKFYFSIPNHERKYIRKMIITATWQKI